jgi:tetratricopeptide (TPR) repeat protein
MKRKVIIGVLLVTMLLSGISCAHLQHKKTDVQTAENVRAGDIAGIISLSNEHAAKGEFKSAIDVYKDAADKYPEDKTLEAGYIATIEDIKKAGDRAFDKGDFTLSGKTYYLLLKNVLQPNELAVDLSFTKKSLTDRLDMCYTELSQQALIEYRSGNIENAISLWKSILSFDPGNKSIKKSIDTATTQLKNLKRSN